MNVQNPFPTLDNASAAAAFARVLPEATALSADQLKPVNLDVASAVIIAMRVRRRLQAYEAELRSLPQYPPNTLERFTDYVLALWNGQSRYNYSTTPPEELRELLEKGMRWRDIMVVEANSLILRGHLHTSLLGELTKTTGYKNVASDLSGLATMFMTHWASIEEKTGLARSELEEAEGIAMRLVEGLAYRDEATDQAPDASAIRQRMFSLFLSTYDELRRCMTYLRWQAGDVDNIIPSLYAGRSGSRRTEGEAVEEPEETQEDPGTSVNIPIPTLPLPPTGVPDLSPTLTLPTSPTTPPAKPARIPVGMPGSDPLMPE